MTIDSRELAAARLLAQSLVAAGRYEGAIEILRGVAVAEPGDVHTRRALTYALLRCGEYAEAEPLARELAGLATGRDRAPALFFHAHALWGCGRLEECRATVEQYSRQLEAEHDA